RQRAQVIAVEAAHACAERSLAERHRGLFDRGRKYDVEADDLGAAVDDRGQHLADLARPGDGRRAVERRRAEGLLVERHHDPGGTFRRLRIAVDAPAQRSENVDGQTAQRIERRRGSNEARGKCDQEGCECSAQTRSVHERAADPQPGGKRMSRLTTGVLPVLVLVLALASTLKMTVRLAVSGWKPPPRRRRASLLARS